MAELGIAPEAKAQEERDIRLPEEDPLFKEIAFTVEGNNVELGHSQITRETYETEDGQTIEQVNLIAEINLPEGPKTLSYIEKKNGHSQYALVLEGNVILTETPNSDPEYPSEELNPPEVQDLKQRLLEIVREDLDDRYTREIENS